MSSVLTQNLSILFSNIVLDTFVLFGVYFADIACGIIAPVCIRINKNLFGLLCKGIYFDLFIVNF